MIETDVFVVGAGPIGLELAVALKRAGVDYVHVEAQQIGQTIAWFPRQCRFFSSPDRIAICGVPLVTADQSKATREEYLAYLRGIVQQFDLNVNTYARVTRLRSLEPTDKPDQVGARFHIETQRADGQHEYRARNVILAIGDMHRPRKLTHPDLPEVPGSGFPHVSHYFDEPHKYFRQKLLIVGGRNSAVEAAIRCHRAGAKVSLSYRQEKFDESTIKYWLQPEIDWLIESGEIAFYPNTLPTRITPTAVILSSTTQLAADPPERTSVDIPVDFVLLLIGYEMDNTLLRMAGVELTGPNQAPVLDPNTMQTDVPGLYVAGTAAAGTQVRFKLFIENCHAHVVRIVRSIAGEDPGHINPLAYRHLDQHPLAAES